MALPRVASKDMVLEIVDQDNILRRHAATATVFHREIRRSGDRSGRHRANIGHFSPAEVAIRRDSHKMTSD